MGMIPESYYDLLDNPVVVVITTMMDNGFPQSSAVWVSRDGDFVKVNVADTRQKYRNVQKNTKVNVFALDPQNPYRCMEIRGEVISIEEDEGNAHINSLAKKYVNKDLYFGDVQSKEQGEIETRIVLTIKPVKVNAYGNS